MKSAENKHYKRIKFLTCFLTGIIFCANSIAKTQNRCHDGKFLRPDDGCGNCTPCTTENLKAYFGNGYTDDMFCPGFGEGKDWKMYGACQKPYDGKDIRRGQMDGIVSWTKSTSDTCFLDLVSGSDFLIKLNKDVDCDDREHQAGVWKCNEVFGDGGKTKKYTAVKNKTSQGDTDRFNSCKITKVYCEAGFAFDYEKSSNCDRPCYFGRKCTKGWHEVICDGVSTDGHVNCVYYGDMCGDRAIPNDAHTECCSCPAGFSINEHAVTITGSIFTGGQKTFSAWEVCVKKQQQTLNYDNGEVKLAFEICGDSAGGVECPAGTYRPAGKSTCENITKENMTLTKEDLKYGPDGPSAPLHKQCWTKTKESDYKKCMLFDK